MLPSSNCQFRVFRNEFAADAMQRHRTYLLALSFPPAGAFKLTIICGDAGQFPKEKMGQSKYKKDCKQQPTKMLPPSVRREYVVVLLRLGQNEGSELQFTVLLLAEKGLSPHPFGLLSLGLPSMRVSCGMQSIEL
mgnify:CR=1 FL=1